MRVGTLFLKSHEVSSSRTLSAAVLNGNVNTMQVYSIVIKEYMHDLLEIQGITKSNAHHRYILIKYLYTPNIKSRPSYVSRVKM